MSRRVVGTAVAAVSAAIALAACNGNAGTRVQTAGNSPPPSVSSSNPTTSTTPSGFGTAQPAVDVVVKVQSFYATAARHPSPSSSSTFDKYLGGQAKIAFDGSLKAARTAGVEYRGTPPTPRMRIITDRTSESLPEVVLQNCPLSSSADPFVAYYVNSGRPVPIPRQMVPQPYAQTAKVFRINGTWVITSFTTDDTKTCTP